MVTRGVEGGEMGIIAYWIGEFQFEKVLEMDSGDGGPTMWKYLMLLNDMLKNDSNGKFYVMHIYHNFF